MLFMWSYFNRMENAGNIGSRRREGKKYAVEDEALDRIAKEVSVLIFQYKINNGSVLKLSIICILLSP